MKLTNLGRATLIAAALIAIHLPLLAQPVVNSGYSTSSYYTTPDSNTIVSYDWDSSNNLYFQTGVTSDFSFNLGGFYKYSSGTTSTLTPGSTSNFVGASVVDIGSYVYFNDGLGNIYSYNPTVGGSPAIISTTTNFGLYKGPDNTLYISGSPDFVNNHVYHTALAGNGNLVTDPATDLGAQPGNSGPLAFDPSGNLYYAPGFNDLSIYKWTAAQVAAALLNPSTSPLVTGNSSASGDAQTWLNYTSLYGSVSGGTSLLIENGELLLTLTNFSGPSDLAAFGIDSLTGDYNGASTTILQDSNILGELRLNGGNLFVSDGTQILQIEAVPESSSLLLLALGLGSLLYVRGRRARKLVPVAAVVSFGFFLPINPASAYTLAPAQQVTTISGTDTSIQEWANSVINFNPGPVVITSPAGAKASFGTSSNALGTANATYNDPNPTATVVSLGDGGSMTLSFAQPITNGTGADFAVFENGFQQSPGADFLELANVSVSSDGVNFFTFPSVSLTQTSTQVGTAGTLDPSLLYNLAGSAMAGYGTPFNLDDLIGVSPLLNVNNIIDVRVTDVIGNINTGLGAGTYTYDDASNPIFNGAYGLTSNLINDPYTTPFNSGGFDLDAIGVIHTVPEPSMTGYFLLGLAALIIRHYLRRRKMGA